MDTSNLESLVLDSQLGSRLRSRSVPITRRESGEGPNMASQFVSERFRCPAGFLDFRVNGSLSPDSGYFKFGPQTICYGRTTSGNRALRADHALQDLFEHAAVAPPTPCLPMDPNEVIENLLWEHYPQSRLTGYERVLKRIYYWLRPATNESVRRRIQRFHARNWENRSHPRWPVDTSVESICESLLLLAMECQGHDRIPFVWFWPDGAQSCVAMTHDVETEAGRDWCEQLMDLDEAYGMKASFQIVPECRYTVSDRFLEGIRSRGFEIGIQDLNHDGRLFDNREEFLRRAELINRYGRRFGAKGFRAAVLYRNPEWLDSLEFSFDMSFPNVAPLDPQRGGCCTVLPYFIGSILELPVTTTQDYTLFYLMDEYSINLWQKQISLIREKNGLVSFIVHPDYLLAQRASRAYEDLLVYLQQLRGTYNLWFALPSEIDRWWRIRNRLSVVRCGNSYQIEGEGSDRAVLAFATNRDGRLVYELDRAPGMQ